MDKPILKKIDILVFPSFGHNVDLRNKVGHAKFNQWVKQIQLAGQRKDTAFLIIPNSVQGGSVFEKKINAALKANLPGAHYILKRDSIFDHKNMIRDLYAITQLLEKNFSFKDSVSIRRYGQHAPNACIEDYGGKLSSSLKELLQRQGVVFREERVNGLSIKFPEYYFLEIARKKVGEKNTYTQEQEIIRIVGALRGKKRFNPVKVAHAIKRSRSMGGVAQKLGRLMNLKKGKR